MAAKVYTVYKANWVSAVAGKNDVTIDEVTDISVSLGGNVDSFFGDGDLYTTFTWMENIAFTLGLTMANLSLLGIATHLLEKGDTGILTLKFPQRLAGSGGRSGEDNECFQVIGGAGGAPAQETGCLLVGTNLSGGQTGITPSNLEFSLSSKDGVSSPIALSMTTLS